MNLRVARWSGVLVFGAGVALAAPALRAEGQAKAPAAVDLSGRWRRNKELSDNEEAKVRAAVAARVEQQPADSGPSGEPEGEGSEGGRGGRGGRGGGMGGRTGRGSPLQSVDEDDPRGAKRTAGPPDAMTVTQVESEIVVEETPGQTRNLYPNGKTYKTDEGATQIRTSWKDGKLVVEKKNVRGWRLVERWELAPDRGRVVIHLLLEGGSRPKLTLTRVYDRDDASTPR
jgi:hypothetical protein